MVAFSSSKHVWISDSVSAVGLSLMKRPSADSLIAVCASLPGMSAVPVSHRCMTALKPCAPTSRSTWHVFVFMTLLKRCTRTRCWCVMAFHSSSSTFPSVIRPNLCTHAVTGSRQICGYYKEERRYLKVTPNLFIFSHSHDALLSVLIAELTIALICPLHSIDVPYGPWWTCCTVAQVQDQWHVQKGGKRTVAMAALVWKFSQFVLLVFYFVIGQKCGVGMVKQTSRNVAVSSGY